MHILFFTYKLKLSIILVFYKNYNAIIFRIIKYKLKIKTKLNSIKIHRNFGTFNKFLKGVNIISINPMRLLIKNRG